MFDFIKNEGCELIIESYDPPGLYEIIKLQFLRDPNASTFWVHKNVYSRRYILTLHAGRALCPWAAAG
jgi:hypothetical protein